MPDIPELDSWLSTQTWPDLRDLINNISTTVYMHPYGFVVCRLDAEWFPAWQIRIHLWPSQVEMLQRIRENGSADYLIHCHGWDLKSVVNLGRLIETRYELASDTVGTLSTYRVTSDYGVGISELTLEGDQIQLNLNSKLSRDSSTGVWSIYAGDFHSTVVADGPAVSIVATSLVHRGESKVIGPSTAESRISNNRNPVDEIDDLLRGYDLLYDDQVNGADHWASFVFLLDESERILLARPSRRPDLWQPIGGRAERTDQDPIATVIRETREEVGIHLDRSQLSELTVADRDAGEGMVYFSVARIGSSAISRVARPEILELRWIPIADILSLPIYNGTRSALELLGRRLRDEGHTDR